MRVRSRKSRKGPVERDMDMGAQLALALSNVVTVLEAAGGKAAHLVNLRVYVTHKGVFNVAGKVVSATSATLLIAITRA